MLGKLLKYEFKATARTFLPLYAAILVVALFNAIFLNPEGQFSNIQGIGLVVLVALFVALGVLTVIVTVQRFNKNLLGDEGYLMFTLPVSAKSLIASKGIVATVWCILSGIVAMISFGIIGLVMLVKTDAFSMFDWSMFWSELSKVIGTKEFLDGILMLVAWIVLGVLSYLAAILIIYFSISVGQLPVFNKRRKAAAFITFFIVNIVINYLGVLIMGETFVDTPFITSNGVMISLYASTLIEILIFFFGTSFILEKKLNLE